MKSQISYKNAAGKISRSVLHPYTLTVYKRGLYLLAVSEERNFKPRLFNLERITRANWLKNETFTYPQDWDPEQYFKKALFIVTGEPQKITLSFTKTSEPFLRLRQFHHTQRLKKQLDKSLQMTLTVPITFELINWIFSFGQYVQVISPATLRRDIVKHLQVALTQYRFTPAEMSEANNQPFISTEKNEELTNDLIAEIEEDF